MVVWKGGRSTCKWLLLLFKLKQNRWSKSGKNVPLFHFDYIFIKILNFYILSTNQVVLFISLFEFKSVFNIHTSFVFKENTYGHTKANWWWLSHQRKITASVTPKHGATWRPNKSHGDCHIRQRRVWRYQRDNQNLYIQEEQTTQWPKEKIEKDKQRSTKHTHKTKDRATRIPLKTNHDEGHNKTTHEEHVV